MAKKILAVSESYDFYLIGIACHYKDYRLCHEINSNTNLNLKREDDLEIFDNKTVSPILFSLYKFQNEDSDLFYLITNKSGINYLLPEQKQIDFFLLIKNISNHIDYDELIKQLKSIPIIIGIFVLNPKRLKSKKHLVF